MRGIEPPTCADCGAETNSITDDYCNKCIIRCRRCKCKINRRVIREPEAVLCNECDDRLGKLKGDLEYLTPKPH